MAKKRKNGKSNKNNKHFAAYGPAGAPQAAVPATGILGRMEGLLGKNPMNQYLVGALLGATAVYVLGDEKLRSKLMKSGMQLYENAMGGLAELQEQMADMRAEIDSERDASQ